jgi:hypothetical protein
VSSEQDQPRLPESCLGPDGAAFGAGERVGFLVNLSKRTVQLFRDGVALPGAAFDLPADANAGRNALVPVAFAAARQAQAPRASSTASPSSGRRAVVQAAQYTVSFGDGPLGLDFTTTASPPPQVYVASVMPGCQAEAAGVTQGDRILSVADARGGAVAFGGNGSETGTQALAQVVDALAGSVRPFVATFARKLSERGDQGRERMLEGAEGVGEEGEQGQEQEEQEAQEEQEEQEEEQEQVDRRRGSFYRQQQQQYRQRSSSIDRQ